MDIISQIVQAAIEHPTPEMFKWFFERTQDHIARVANNMLRVADYYHLDKQKLIMLSKQHDASKYTAEECIFYVYLSWQHKMKNENKEYVMPEGMDEKINKATMHHIKTNRHHPEFFDDPNDMELYDIIEMACDWAAMSQELGTSLKKWVQEEGMVNYEWNTKNKTRIKNLITIFKELK
ncbi:MAG: DUF5662 family protein [Candidatus Firestonebacteria bacterium]